MRSNSIHNTERKADERLINDNDGLLSAVINTKQTPFNIRGRLVRRDLLEHSTIARVEVLLWWSYPLK